MFDVYVTVHHQYIDVNNQQDATTFRLLIFLNQPNMFQATNSPILRSIFNCIYSLWYSAPPVLPIGSRGGALYQMLYIQLKSAPKDGRVYHPKHVGLI